MQSVNYEIANKTIELIQFKNKYLQKIYEYVISKSLTEEEYSLFADICNISKENHEKIGVKKTRQLTVFYKILNFLFVFSLTISCIEVISILFLRENIDMGFSFGFKEIIILSTLILTIIIFTKQMVESLKNSDTDQNKRKQLVEFKTFFYLQPFIFFLTTEYRAIMFIFKPLFSFEKTSSQKDRELS